MAKNSIYSDSIEPSLKIILSKKCRKGLSKTWEMLTDDNFQVVDSKHRIAFSQVTPPSRNSNTIARPFASLERNSALLPSEVKYSASLVQVHAVCHFILSLLMFVLGILGASFETDLNWSGSGVWCGVSLHVCSLAGFGAHKFWFKNWTIKIFLLSIVVAEVTLVAGLVLVFYSITIKHVQYFNYPWFSSQASLTSTEQYRDSATITANLIIAKIFSFLLCLWSFQIAWKGAAAQEFSLERRRKMLDHQNSKAIAQAQLFPPHLPFVLQILQLYPDILKNELIHNTSVLSSSFYNAMFSRDRSSSCKIRVTEKETSGKTDIESGNSSNSDGLCSNEKEKLSDSSSKTVDYTMPEINKNKSETNILAEETTFDDRIDVSPPLKGKDGASVEK